MATNTNAPKKRLSEKRAEEREAAKQRDAKRQKLVFAAVGVGVLALVVLIAVLTASESGSAVRTEDLAGTPSIDGADLSLAPREGEDPDIGAQAPVVEGADFDGSSVTIGEPGTPQLLMFLASWCPACQEELPEVVAWEAAGGVPDGVELTAVITGLDDSRPNWPPDTWVEEEDFTGPVIVDDAEGSIAEAYGLPATPYWVALDADGQVVARVAGMMSAQQLDLLAASVATDE